MQFPITISGYTIDKVRDEVDRLVSAGTLSYDQPIYALGQHMPARQWASIARKLDQHGYLLCQRIMDLLGADEWLAE